MDKIDEILYEPIEKTLSNRTWRILKNERLGTFLRDLIVPNDGKGCPNTIDIISGANFIVEEESPIRYNFLYDSMDIDDYMLKIARADPEEAVVIGSTKVTLYFMNPNNYKFSTTLLDDGYGNIIFGKRIG